MISLLCYVVLYYNIDVIFKQIYLPCVNINNNYDVISNDEGLYFLLKMTSYFMLLLYSYTITCSIFISNKNDKYSIGLMLVYLKHIFDIIIHKNMLIIEYEISRGVMWVFTTPLMLKMYCKVNDITLKNINIHYHLICIIAHVFVIPFKYNSCALFDLFKISSLIILV